MDTVSELLSKSTTDRFWSKVDKRGPDECWPWLDYCDPKGYGRFNTGYSNTRYAHRYAWLFTYGAWPAETIDHLCNNKSCQNVDHMEDVSSTVNTHRRDERLGNPMRRKSHCKHGHLFDDENTAYSKEGWRSCRTCSRIRSAEFTERRRASE